MKDSTITLLNDAMEFNTEVQEDNLNLQEQCNQLCDYAFNLQKYIQLSNDIKRIEGTKDATAICDRCFNQLKDYSFTDEAVLKSLENYSSMEELERPTFFYNKLNTFNRNSIDYISKSLLNMIECSIADLDKKVTYPIVKELKDITTVVYNYHAIDNLTTTLSEMLTSICKLGCENLTYTQLKQKFSDINYVNIGITNTYINQNDYTEIGLPCPKNQSTKDAELTPSTVNEMSRLINTIVSSENLKDLAKIKYSISNRLSKEDKVDAIKSIHFISQIVMAIKNSVITLQNYHKVFFNELM